MDSLYEVASHLEITERWRLSLTEDEHMIFVDFLGDKEKWIKFMNLEEVTCGIPCTPEALRVVALRSRAMLFESYLPGLFSGSPQAEESFDFRKSLPSNGLVGSNSASPLSLEALYSAEALAKPLGNGQLPLDGMYYTLEFADSDEGDLPEQNIAPSGPPRNQPEQRIEDKKVEEQKPVAPVQKKRRKIVEPPDFITAAGKIRHLWEAIQDFNYEQATEAISTKDLKTLVAGSNPVKSKWFHEYRYGQDVLYDACEKVLNLLINFKEHSKPFLQKVQKRDVQDYYDIISNPMDLGTIGKKLKSHKYNSKREFLDDVNLIYDNCRKYNGTSIENPYTMHASAMEKRTEKLALTIPDITVRDLLDPRYRDMPLSPLGLIADDDSEHAHSPSSHDSPMKMDHSLSMDVVDFQTPLNGLSRTHDDSPMSFTLEISQRNGGLSQQFQPASSDISTPTANGIHHEHSQPIATSSSKLPRPVIVLQDEYSFGGIVNRETDIQALSWKEAFLKPDFKNRKRSRQHMEFGDTPAFVRSPEELASFIQHSTPQTKESQSQRTQFYPELHPMSSIPYLQTKRDSATKKNLPPPTGPKLEQNPIVKNIETLNRIRTLRASIEVELSGKNAENEAPPPREEHDSLKVTGLKSLGGPPILNEESARCILGKATTLIFAHAGFEGVSPLCKDMVVDLVARYFQNFGKVMDAYNSSQLPDRSTENSLLRTLRQLGVNKLDHLEEYWKVDVLHFGYKLNDIERKLRRKYRELSFGTASEMDENDFSDQDIEGDVAFLSGNFSDDLDIDFFGFKEMGLDGLRVPNSLIAPGLKSKFLRDRLSAIAAKKDGQTSTAQGFISPPPFPPILPQEQIGLLKDFFTKLSAQEDGITEDDQLSAQKKVERKIAASETDQAEYEEVERESKNAKKAQVKVTKKKATKKPDEP